MKRASLPASRSISSNAVQIRSRSDSNQSRAALLLIVEFEHGASLLHGRKEASRDFGRDVIFYKPAVNQPMGNSAHTRGPNRFGGISKDLAGMKNLLATIALGAAIISAQAFAQDDHGGRGGWTQRDMTRQQAQQMADDMFQRFDANHDGVLTRQEAEQAAAQFGGSGRAERMIDRMFGRFAVADAAAGRGASLVAFRP